MQAKILDKVQKYLQDKFSNTGIRLKQSQSDEDMAEVYMNDEFIGTLYRDVDDNEVSFDFNMSIIDIDLE
ncbi:MAG: DUF3126 family protein [Rickettsiales bacterium]|jgi:hypothetical protein|nr:DUF3126 family protein [Rickettsiales bacterium]